MSAPESSVSHPTAWPLPWQREQAGVAPFTTYTTRSTWTYRLESAWSRFAKFQLLNCLNWPQLSEALAIRPAANASAGIDLRAADAFDLARLANTLHVEPHDLGSAFCTPSRHDALLDAASPVLRFCPVCAAAGFHAALFQFTTFKRCPMHWCALREACTHCGQPIAYRLHTRLIHRPYACPTCGRSLLSTPLHRLHRQLTVGTAELDRLHAWHDYFFWHAHMLSMNKRHERDASGQYLSSDAIRDRSEMQRRLAFIGELQAYLHCPPGRLRIEPTPSASSKDQPGSRASASKPVRCAWERNWPHVDPACIALYTVYRNTRRNHVRRLARSIRPVQPAADAISPLTRNGMLLIDGSVSAMSVAFLGWRLSWERRFSVQTLARCPKHYPPFGLLEWLAFMPVYLQPPAGASDRQDWLLRHFVHALAQTWSAWCAIASGMRENGCYVISPLLLPTRVLWLDTFEGSNPTSVSVRPAPAPVSKAFR